MNKSFYKQALQLTIPIALQNLLTSCAAMIDTAMVVVLGNTATSALGVAARWPFLLNVMCFGFCSGSAALISQFWGAGDKESIRKTYGEALTLSSIVTVVMSLSLICMPGLLMRIFTGDAEVLCQAAQYGRIYGIGIVFVVFTQISCAALKATARVYVPLISSAVAVCINVFFNYGFINGNMGFPRLGIRGAALATVLSEFVQSIIVLLFIVFGKTDLSSSLKNIFSYDLKSVKKFLRVTVPVIGNESLWAIGTNVYIMVLARQGTENYSGYTIFETVQQLSFVFFVGICHACSIMVGSAVGRGQYDEAYKTAKRYLIITPTGGLIIGIVFILIRNPLLNLLSIETQTAYNVASAALLFYGLWLAVKMIPYTCICGIFRAGGDTKKGLKYDMLCMYLIGIPAVILSAVFIKPAFIILFAIMYISEEVPKAIFCVKHFVSKKWIFDLTKR